MKKLVGVLLGVWAILAGLVAALFSFKPLFIGAFLALVGMWPVLLLVLAGLAVLAVPGVLGIVAIVGSFRAKDGSNTAVLCGALGILLAIGAGKGFYALGERLHPDPSNLPKPERPKDCKVKTEDTSAIGRTCAGSGSGVDQGDCPASYWCQGTMAQLQGDKSKPQYTCQITCLHDCECPSGLTCRNVTCQRGKDLPP